MGAVERTGWVRRKPRRFPGKVRELEEWEVQEIKKWRSDDWNWAKELVEMDGIGKEKEL